MNTVTKIFLVGAVGLSSGLVAAKNSTLELPETETSIQQEYELGKELASFRFQTLGDLKQKAKETIGKEGKKRAEADLQAGERALTLAQKRRDVQETEMDQKIAESKLAALKAQIELDKLQPKEEGWSLYDKVKGVVAVIAVGAAAPELWKRR